MVRIIKGDLTQSSAKYICHQVNCQGVMGSGVAKQIRGKWPEVFDKYKQACDKHADHRESLLGQILIVRVSENTAIINIFGQLKFGRDGQRYTNFEALCRGCREIANNVSPGDTIAMPYKIGCGLGGGDWGRVMDMLTDVFSEHHLTLYKI